MPEPLRPGPLAHLRVLDLSRLYPGALCTLLLADLGADVLKVEAPGFGDGLRSVYGPSAFPAAHVALNRGKRSLSLDLKHPEAPAVLRRLVRHVDVVVESQRPGSLEAAGIGFPQLREEQPGLVWCSLSGFGLDGPHAQAPGHDITYLGYAGVLGLLLEAGRRPPIPQLTVGVPTGALMGVIGILAALAARERTGEGAHVDASLVDSSMWLISEDVVRAAAEPGPGWGLLAARAVYQGSDGAWVTVAATEARPWGRLCAALGLDDLAERRLGDDEPGVAARLAAAFATRPAADWVRDPGLAGGVGPVHTPADLLDDPHVQARERIVTLDGSDTRVLAAPVRMAGVQTTAATAAPPEHGADTDAALANAGYSADEIAALHADGVV
jgi:alpha-methylacyl-CoA racemase